MGIFKNITKTLKQAAPFIGSAIGMYYGGSFGAALGSGIGSLAAGRSTEEALRNAALTGATSYALGGKDFGKDGVFSTADSPLFGRTPVGADVPDGRTGISKIPGFGTTAKDSSSFFTSPSGIATIGLGAAVLGDKQEAPMMGSRRPDPVGRSRLGVGLVGDKAYNLDDPDERNQYFEDLRKQQGVTPTKFVADGGEITGPGTGTSDSVPARLSDGEFVLTAKSVRGAGGGDRDLGAARMYDMMSKLERVA